LDQPILEVKILLFFSLHVMSALKLLSQEIQKGLRNLNSLFIVQRSYSKFLRLLIIEKRSERVFLSALIRLFGLPIHHSVAGKFFEFFQEDVASQKGQLKSEHAENAVV